MRRGIVSLDGERVGVIEEIPGGTRFSYDAEYIARAEAQPISLTLPLDGGPWESPGLHPFFENLLPEGWLLELSVRTLKISRDDAFGVLLATCADCAGAVEVRPAPETDARPNPEEAC